MIKQPILTDHEHLLVLVQRLCVIHKMERDAVCAHLGITKSTLSHALHYKTKTVKKEYIQKLTSLCELKEAGKNNENLKNQNIIK